MEAGLVAGTTGSMDPRMSAKLPERLLNRMNGHPGTLASNKKGRLESTSPILNDSASLIRSPAP
jgi:hypothetical protein